MKIWENIHQQDCEESQLKWIRQIISENNLSVSDLILPIFVREGKNKVEAIKSMPSVYRYSIDKLNIIMNKVKRLKIPMVVYLYSK